MKNQYVSRYWAKILFTALLVMALNGLYLSYSLKIAVQTSSPDTEITVKWRKTPDSQVFSKTVKSNGNGNAQLKIGTRRISLLKIETAG